jgi:hypothetical protein
MTAHTQCFRSEAGSAGKDTTGHAAPAPVREGRDGDDLHARTALAEHERMTRCAEAVLERLGLPYRTIVLCTGDMGFGAQKTHDLEVWLPGQNTYREISSVSTCGQFQARRMNARYRPAGGKPEFVATLNGSGLAVGRCLIAVLENGQQADGSVDLPAALVPYLGGKTRISLSATVPASAAASSASASGGTARLTRPSSTRAGGVDEGARGQHLEGRLRGMLRLSATIGVEQKSPMFTPLTPNRVPSAATAMSQAATSWQPAAVAMPCTSAITGCGRVAGSPASPRRSGEEVREVMRARPPSRRLAASSRFRSWPAQKARPAPRRTTRGCGSSAHRVEARLQRGQHRIGQRVELVGAVERQPRHRAAILAQTRSLILPSLVVWRSLGAGGGKGKAWT